MRSLNNLSSSPSRWWTESCASLLFSTRFESKNREIWWQFWRLEEELLKRCWALLGRRSPGVKLEKGLLNDNAVWATIWNCEQWGRLLHKKCVVSALLWTCYHKNPVSLWCLQPVLITPWSKGSALPAGCWEAPAGTAEHWDRSCSQKHGKWPSGCRKCLVARLPSLWLLPFPSSQRALSDKDAWCGVLHAGAVVVTSYLCTSPQVIIKINTSAAAAASPRAYLLPQARSNSCREAQAKSCRDHWKSLQVLAKAVCTLKKMLVLGLTYRHIS